MALPFVDGSTSPGFESVQDVFSEAFERSGEASAQLVVYFQGEKVVDLWGSTTDPNYGPNSLQNVFSSAKVLSSLVAAKLVDLGKLDYSSKV